MRFRALFVIAVLAVASPGLVEAQSITGSVRDQTSGSPVGAAQVFLEGLNIGGLTQSNGQYLLAACGRTNSRWSGKRVTRVC